MTISQAEIETDVHVHQPAEDGGGAQAGRKKRPESSGKMKQAFHRQVSGLALVIPIFLAACNTNGDFGRVKPSLVTDDIHAWVGRVSSGGKGARISELPIVSEIPVISHIEGKRPLPLTDNERLLRDLAYPLIKPPFERDRWYRIVNEYGIRRVFDPQWPGYNVASYSENLLREGLLSKKYRSETARYARLNADIRNDVIRIPSFFSVARRVLDIDLKRGASMKYVEGLSREENHNATARMAENMFVVCWVQNAVRARADSYQYALGHLVTAAPSHSVVEVETSLNLLHTTIDENVVVPQSGLESCVKGAISPVAVSLK